MHIESLQPVQETSAYAVHYQQHPVLLKGKLLRNLSAQEFTEGCEMLLAMAQYFNCRFWLLDGRANASLHPFSIRNWLEEDFLPRALTVLGRPPCLAYLVPAHWQVQPGTSYVFSSNELSLATYRMALFEAEADAMAWFDRFRAW